MLSARRFLPKCRSRSGCPPRIGLMEAGTWSRHFNSLRSCSGGWDAIHVSSGGLHPGQRIPVGPGYQVPFARTVKKEVKMPVVALDLSQDSIRPKLLLERATPNWRRSVGQSSSTRTGHGMRQRSLAARCAFLRNICAPNPAVSETCSRTSNLRRLKDVGRRNAHSCGRCLSAGDGCDILHGTWVRPSNFGVDDTSLSAHLKLLQPPA